MFIREIFGLISTNGDIVCLLFYFKSANKYTDIRDIMRKIYQVIQIIVRIGRGNGSLRCITCFAKS